VGKSFSHTLSGFESPHRGSQPNGGGGIRNPKLPLTDSNHTPNKITTKPPQDPTDKSFTNCLDEQKDADSQQNNNNDLHKKCAICVHHEQQNDEKLSPELAEIVAVWSELPEHIKTAIKALVSSSVKTK